MRDTRFKARISYLDTRIPYPASQAQILHTLSQSGNSMMVHCCTGLDLNRQDEPFFNDQQIGVQRGEVGRAFEIKVCPARERMAGERALPALAWAREEHGRKRAEEDRSSPRNMNAPVEVIDGTSVRVAIFEGKTIYRRPAGEAQP